VSARRLLLKTIITALCLTAGVAIVMLLAGNLDRTSAQILLTSTEVSFFGLLAVPAGMLLERNRRSWLGRSSAALTTIAFGLTLFVTWNPEASSAVWRGWGVVGTLTLAAAQAATVEARRRDTDSPTIGVLVGCSMLTAAVLAALGVGGILGSIDDGGYIRLLGVFGVLDVLLLAVIAVLRRGSGPVDQTHRMRVDGRLVEASGRDFAAAVANAIRDAEKAGTPVRRVERA
jgi:hypothetical protein